MTLLSLTASAVPAPSAFPVEGPDDTVAVAAAALSGWKATADSFDDQVEIRDVDGALVRTITRAQIQSLLPWFDLNGSQDGPCALAYSDSGRFLYIACFDANAAGDGQPSDAILRYDTQGDALSLFARLEIFGADNPWPHASMAHFKGRLYVGLVGGVQCLRAAQNDATGVPLFFANVAGGQQTNGLAVDRLTSTIYAAANGQVYRSPIGASSLNFANVGAVPGVRALAWSDHFGGPAQGGLYAMDSNSTASPIYRVWAISPAMARGQAAFSPALYLAGFGEWHDLASTADGALLAGADEDAVQIRDTTDTRLDLPAWIADEFAQHVTLARGLVTTSPAGWVIDADVAVGGARFHPATPDAAAWVVLLSLVHDDLAPDPADQQLVRTILERYAGRAADGIVPSRNPDGIFRHWYEPSTGNVKAGWDPEFATLSTMKIVHAAARAAARYPGDASIQASAHDIICSVGNWEALVRTSDDRMFFKALPAGGADPTSITNGFHEGIIFVAQAAALGPPPLATTYDHWLDRARWPAYVLTAGYGVSCAGWGIPQPTFLSIYPMMMLPEFRDDPNWQAHVRALRVSHMGWTDDNGPQFATVFSAGTTRSDWGGYHADHLADHPGNVTTFTSLLGFAGALGAAELRLADIASGYQAYRAGARQALLSGASLLYRRSDVDRAYTPDSAGLPDVTIGALGLAEVLSPGVLSRVVAGEYPSCTACVADVDDGTGSGVPDGGVTIDDLLYYLGLFDAGSPAADIDDGSATGNPDGGVTIDDLIYFLVRFDAGC